MARVIRRDIDVHGLTSNFALERTAGSRALAGAGHRGRWTLAKLGRE